MKDFAYYNINSKDIKYPQKINYSIIEFHLIGFDGTIKDEITIEASDFKTLNALKKSGYIKVNSLIDKKYLEDLEIFTRTRDNLEQEFFQDFSEEMEKYSKEEIIKIYNAMSNFLADIDVSLTEESNDMNYEYWELVHNTLNSFICKLESIKGII